MSAKKERLSRKVECPRCWVEMDQEEVKVIGPDYLIDICPGCNGIWLDGGELAKQIKDRKLADYLTKDIGTKTNSKLLCPRCASLMDIEKADDTEVDVCLACHGVWLDQGELEELKAKSDVGFEGDALAKAEEKREERRYRDRHSPVKKFFRRLGRT